MNRRSLAISAVVFSAWAVFSSWEPTLAAQETATDAEKSWRELRDSEDVRTKLLAERWYNVIRLQDWTNDTGKFTTKAKYVAHDPDLKWVKLRVVQGSGDKRVVKDITIPLEKLNKTCQSRVRQIHVLTEKVAEAATADEADEVGGASDAAAGEMPGERGEYDAGLAGMDPNQVVAERESPSPDRDGGALGNDAPVTNNGPPLPALIPGVPTTGLASAPAIAQPSAAAESAPGDEAWRTSYDAFRANFQSPSDSRSGTLEWGSLAALKEAHDTLMQFESTGSVSEADMAEISRKLDAVGEVSWDATLLQTSDQQGEWTEALGLPPLPEPMTIGFILDPERDPGPWQNLKAGDPVRFTGRFYMFDEEHGLVVAIRFTGDRYLGGAAPTDGRDR